MTPGACSRRACSRRALLAGATAAVLAPVLAARAQATGRRIALVIGNGDYQDADAPPLNCAEHDAPEVGARLSRLGFDVDVQLNLAEARLGPAVAAFGEKLRLAGPDAVSVFYYAGHAAQDLAQINYLLPVDARAGSPERVREQGTPIQRILDDMGAADNPVNVLIIDACRDWFENDRRQSRPRGLRDMVRRGNVLIAMATTAGDTADEGEGPSSPYTARLLEALDNHASDPLSLMFDDINSKVHADTGGEQAPDYLNGVSRIARWSLRSPVGTAGALAPLGPPVRPFTRTPDFLRSLDRARLVAFTRGRESFVETLLSRRDLLTESKIDSPVRLAYFLAMIGHESGGFRPRMDENLNYSAPSLRRLFPRRFPTDQDAVAYARQPERIANLIYADRLGNGDEASGDGWRYRGRGYLMITGRANYRQLGRSVGVPLEEAPDLLSDPEVSLAVTAFYWSARKLNDAADRDDLDAVTRGLVGPRMLGMESRRAWLASAKEALNPSDPGPAA